MARNYTLAPFKPRNGQPGLLGEGTFTAPTTMYTLDLWCEKAKEEPQGDGRKPMKVASNGCRFDLGPDGNDTIGTGLWGSSSDDVSVVKEYSGMYVGYHNAGFADYYLEGGCPKSENTTFYAAFTKSKVCTLILLSPFVLRENT